MNMFYSILFLLILGILTIPYYIFPSGSLQPSHIFLLCFSALLFYHQRGHVILKQNLYSLLFLNIYMFFINSVYVLFYQDINFLLFNMHMILNLIVYFSFSNFFLKENDKFKLERIFTIVFAMAIFIMFLSWLLGFGEYKYYPRYNGFFNDPNQMAFFVLCAMSICFLLVKSSIFYLIILIFGSFLIVLTASRSALVGLILLCVSCIFFLSKNNKAFVYKLMFCFFAFSLVLFFGLQSMFDMEVVLNVLDRLGSTDLDEQADIRGYTRILNYPEYLLFGAGQGLDMRFGSAVEIHSTWAAFLFYYGVIGLSVFILFLFNIFRWLTIYEKILFLAPMLYSFSTFGARTNIFWIFLAVFYVVSLRNRGIK